SGNTAEVDTLKTSLLKVVNTFPIKRVIAVADRGLLSLESLGELQQIVLPSGQPLEFILAVPGRRYKDFQTLLAPFNEHVQSVTSVDPDTEEAEVFGEVEWEGLRLVVAHDPERAAEQTTKRDAKIAQLEARAEQWA
ncbi:IS1634 family transposase, partial [Orrella sp. 11846]